MKNQIKQLIRTNKIEKALELLVQYKKTDRYDHTSILLLSRWNRLQKKVRQGIISHSEESMEHNKIVVALQQYVRDLPEESKNPSETINMDTSSEQDTSSLHRIIRENKRRRPEIAEEARGLVARFRKWQDKKNESPSFDPAGRRLAAIQADEQEFIGRLQEAKKDSLEDVISKVDELLKDPVPNYDDLEKAYNLARGRGMKDRWIEDQLGSQVDDEETKISIAERIEEYTQSIRLT